MAQRANHLVKPLWMYAAWNTIVYTVLNSLSSNVISHVLLGWASLIDIILIHVNDNRVIACVPNSSNLGKRQIACE